MLSSIFSWFYSSVWINSQVMMGCRAQALSHFIKEGNLGPEGFCDKYRLYLFPGFLGHYFNLDVFSANHIAAIIIALISIALGMWGSIFCFRKSMVKAVLASFFVVMFGVYAFSQNSLYQCPGLAFLAVLPLAFGLIKNSDNLKIRFHLYLVLFLVGIILAVLENTRSFSMVPPLFFLTITIMFLVRQDRCYFKLFVPLIVGILIIKLFTLVVTVERNHFLIKHHEHPIIKKYMGWHSVYIGLGYLPNNYGIKYKDEVAEAKVKSVDSSVSILPQDSPNKRYDAILRNAVLEIFINDPKFIISNVKDKFLVVFKNSKFLYGFFEGRMDCNIDGKGIDLTRFCSTTKSNKKAVSVHKALFMFMFYFNVLIAIVFIKRKKIIFSFVLSVLTVLLASLPSVMVMPLSGYSTAFTLGLNLTVVLFFLSFFSEILNKFRIMFCWIKQTYR